jgi:hypothetical protein
MESERIIYHFPQNSSSSLLPETGKFITIAGSYANKALHSVCLLRNLGVMNLMALPLL